MTPTMSALPRLLNCASSAVLPAAENVSLWADMGNDEHEELSDLEALPPDLARWVPPGARAEVKVAYDVVNRTGRIIGSGSGRGYGTLAPFEIPGSIDVLGIDGDRVVIVDWKTGFSEVEPAATNGQLWGYALAACRAFGKSEAVIRIVYTKTGVVDEYEIDTLELAEFANRLADLHPRIAELQAARKRGEPLPTREGSWCKHCASKSVCPSKVGLLAQIAEKGLAVIGDTAMTPSRAQSAYQQIIAVEQLVKDARKRLETYVDEQGPIDLGGGRMYGRYHRKGNEKLDGDVAVQAIRDVVGESAKEFEAIAVERKVSKAAIDRAAKQLLTSGAAKTAAKVITRIRELGGSKRSDERPVGEYAVDKHEAAPPPDFDVAAVNAALAEVG